MVLFTGRDFCSSETTFRILYPRFRIRVKRVFGSARYRHANPSRRARAIGNSKAARDPRDAPLWKWPAISVTADNAERVDFAGKRRGWTRLQTRRGGTWPVFVARAGSRPRLVRWKAD